MKFLLLFCVLFHNLIFSQEQSVQTAQLNELVIIGKNGKVKIDAEKPAYYPPGIQILKDDFMRNFRSRKIITNSETESCEITFVIDKEGNMTEIKAFGKNESFTNESIRAASKIKQKWIPAEMNGEKVRYRFRLPLTVAFNKE